ACDWGRPGRGRGPRGAPPVGGGGPRPGRPAGGGGRPPLAAWRELTDSAWDYGIPPDDSLTPRMAAARIVRDARLAGPHAEAVGRLATAVEQALYAPSPPPAGATASADVEAARAGLRASAGRRARVRAVVAPRSAVRVVWACAGFWAGVRSAARARLRRLIPRSRPFP
ncbi:DUF4129 domain-containing protein, partial [Streptomyces abikoensis]|uniref:DUF4129 domain-containing protein n=1 Tax=Streptomyces abikoensis TaxID=97398 RepID=UPI0036CF5E68